MKATVKLGNWYEELMLEEVTGSRFYANPRDKKNSLGTKDRCISHTDHEDPKNYVSTANQTIGDPHKHRDSLQLATVGPRRAMAESKLKEDVEREFNAKKDSDFSENRKVHYASVARDSFRFKDGFKNSLVENDPRSRVQTQATNYSSDVAVTFYSDQVKVGSANFPLSFSNSIANPFQRSSLFTSNIGDPIARNVESNDRPQRGTNVLDVKVLRGFRKRLIDHVVLCSKSSFPGSSVRGILNHVWRLAEAHGADVLNINDFVQSLDFFRGFVLSVEERASLLVAYDFDSTKRISLPDVSALFRGRMSPRRIELVNLVFSNLDRVCGGEGLVNEEAIREHFQTGHFKKVEELLTGLSGGISGFTFDDFIEYFSCVSAETEDNSTFDKIVSESWQWD